MLDASSQAGSSRPGALLSAVSISKRYGDFLANDNIDLDLYPAEIHALLGENGAGKSTMVKMMYGVIQPSAGELRWMGQKVVLSGPSGARDLGVGMVFQHFTLFDNLTVADNVALGLPPTESFASIAERLEEMHSAREETVAAKRATGTALILVKHRTVEDAFAKIDIRLVSGGRRQLRLNGAFRSGQAAGDRINLARPVGHSGRALIG